MLNTLLTTLCLVMLLTRRITMSELYLPAVFSTLQSTPKPSMRTSSMMSAFDTWVVNKSEAPFNQLLEKRKGTPTSAQTEWQWDIPYSILTFCTLTGNYFSDCLSPLEAFEKYSTMNLPGPLTVSLLATHLWAEPVEWVRTLLTLPMTGCQGGRQEGGQAGQQQNRLPGEVRESLMLEDFTA